MNHEVIVTCAVTGAGDTVGRHPAIPVTPKQIAEAAIEAAAPRHRRPLPRPRPATGKPSRDVALYREVVERIRESDTDVIINLTAGMGGDLEIGKGEQPLEFGAGTDLVGPLERLRHVEELLPEICTLDCGTLNFGDGDYIYVSTPGNCAPAPAHHRAGGQGRAGNLRYRPPLVRQADAQGRAAGGSAVPDLPGHSLGAPADTTTMKAMADNLPPGATWAGFGIGRTQMPMVAQAMLLGGNGSAWRTTSGWTRACRRATGLVERAIEIIERLGGRALSRRKGAAG